MPCMYCILTHRLSQGGGLGSESDSTGARWRHQIELCSQGPSVGQGDGPWNCLAHHMDTKVNEAAIDSQLWGENKAKNKRSLFG